MTFTENSEFAMQNEKRYVYFILFSPFFFGNNECVYILYVDLHVFDHVLRNLFLFEIY